MAFLGKNLTSLQMYMKAFGFFKGLQVYYQFKYGKKGSIRIPGIKHPLFFRPKSADRSSMWEIFIQRDYDIAYPKFWESPKVIIDAGANIGFTSVFFANQYPEAKIYAIEPESANFELLKKNLAPYAPHTLALQNAIWTEKAYVKVVDKGFGARGFMIEETNEQDEEALLALSLNSLVQEYQLEQIDILKMDIEGTEKFLFEGDVEAWLPKVKCLVVEFHDFRLPGCSKSIFKTLSKYNFACKLKGDNLLFFNEDYIPQNEANIQEIQRVLHPAT